MAQSCGKSSASSASAAEALAPNTWSNGAATPIGKPPGRRSQTSPAHQTQLQTLKQQRVHESWRSKPLSLRGGGCNRPPVFMLSLPTTHHTIPPYRRQPVTPPYCIYVYY